MAESATQTTFRRAFALLVLALSAALALPGPASPERLGHFGAGCSRVAVAGTVAELCTSAAARASGRAVIVLQGCGGFGSLDYRIATRLPRAGIATLYPAYFGSTVPVGGKGACGGGYRSAGPVWVRRAVASVGRLRATPGVRFVGVVAWSLGGGVALAAAHEHPDGLRALACFSCGFHQRKVGSLRPLPPTLVLSGGTTDAVPLASSRALVDRLRRAGGRAQLFVYPHGTHQWYGRQGVVGIRHAIAFLDRSLRL
jgi:dienelactone hydrolase